MLHSSKSLVFLLVLALGGFAFTFVKPPQASDTPERVVQDQERGVEPHTIWSLDQADPLVQLVAHKPPPPPPACAIEGEQCPPWIACCPGLTCTLLGDRAFCE